jgi:hypothetical protein
MPSDRCNRRISALSSTWHHSLSATEGVDFHPTLKVRLSAVDETSYRFGDFIMNYHKVA